MRRPSRSHSTLQSLSESRWFSVWQILFNNNYTEGDSVSIQLKTRHWPNCRTNIWINLGYSCSWKCVSKNHHKPSSEHTHVVSKCNGFTWILLLIHLDLRGTVTMLRMLAIFETCHPLADALRDPRSVKWDEICVDLLRFKWWCSCWSWDNKHPVLGLRIDEIAHLRSLSIWTNIMTKIYDPSVTEDSSIGILLLLIRPIERTWTCLIDVDYLFVWILE